MKRKNEKNPFRNYMLTFAGICILYILLCMIPVNTPGAERSFDYGKIKDVNDVDD